MALHKLIVYVIGTRLPLFFESTFNGIPVLSPNKKIVPNFSIRELFKFRGDWVDILGIVKLVYQV
jgi:hypothetical protein